MVRRRLLVFVVAYNAERTIARTLRRIPASLLDECDVEVLVIDDSSQDRTFEHGHAVSLAEDLPFKITVLFNPVNQGYGGNQKIGFHYAIENRFDYVALVHGDGQYAPECLPELVQPLLKGEADAVFGSRMLSRGGALRGGMPLYKFTGNKVLSYLQNRLLRAKLSEFHSGYRLYSVAALQRIPFDLNSNVFHFDTEIIIQLLIAGQRIQELPIPTYYGDEICHVNGMKYAWDVLGASVKARVQETGLLYDPKFDCAPVERANEHYSGKLSFDSPSTTVLDIVPSSARVLDLGCAGGYLGAELRRRGCSVVGVDLHPLANGIELDGFHLHDLNSLATLRVDVAQFDHVLLLDVIEHLSSPERFVETLKKACAFGPDVRVIASTGNVGFLVTRLMLLVGQLNYGKKGILDLTHTRLFTFRTFRRLFEQAGFDVVDVHGMPAPFPLVLGKSRLGAALLWLNRLLIKMRRSLFSYQIVVVARPRPSLEYLLQQAVGSSAARAQNAARSVEDPSRMDLAGV